MSEEGANIIVKNLKGNDLIIVRKEISNLLSQLEEQKKLNEEHQRINGELREENKSLRNQLNFIGEQNNYIERLEKRIYKAIEMCIVVYGGSEDFYVDMIKNIKKELESGDSDV